MGNKPLQGSGFLSNTAAQVAGSVVFTILSGVASWFVAPQLNLDKLLFFYTVLFSSVVGALCYVLLVKYVRSRRPTLRTISKIESVVNEKTAKIDADGLVSSITGSVLEQVLSDFQSGGHSSLVFDKDYYEKSLDVIKSHPRAKAIADLASGLEDWWLKDEASHLYDVNERIFLVPWQWMFDRERVQQCVRMLNRHAGAKQGYHVRFGASPLRERENGSFSPHAKWNMLIADDVVLGYQAAESKFLLRTTWGSGEAARALNEYNTIRDASSFPVRRGVTVADVLSSWFELEKVGDWQKEFNNPDVAARGIEYLDKYDWHIRSWIPRYDSFIDYAAQRTIENIDYLARSSGRRDTRVLEIGFGTGALTKPVLEWIEKDKLARPRKDTNLGVKYYGLDRARDAMLKRMRNNLPDDLIRGGIFENGIAWKEETIPDSLKRAAPYDVIFGSLVLHDMVSKDVARKLDNVVSKCLDRLTPDGKIVFADVCVADDLVERRAKKLEWKHWMMDQGMSEGVADKFLSNNEDMIDTVSRSLLAEVCEKHKLYVDVADYGEDWSPFKIITIQRTCPTP